MIIKKYYISILVLFFAFALQGQSIKYYQKVRNNNKQSIEYSKKILNDLQKTNKNKLDQLYLIQNEIDKRKSTISTINNELILISKNIERNEAKLKDLYFQLENEKNEYARLIYYSYLNLSVQDRMIYILSANSFAKVYKRVIYLKQLTDYRKYKYQGISKSIIKIDSSIVELNTLETEKKNLFSDKIHERDSLITIQRKLNKTIGELKSEIVNLSTSEKKKEKEKEKINKDVKVEISKNISKKETKPVHKKVNYGKVTGTDFAKYKRQHLWPLKKYVLLHKFGNYKHPVLDNIILKNDGIELGAKPNSNVYAIYKGLVVNIISIPGNGQSIIIKHGDYYSVYSKVGKVYVSQGQNVYRGQRIAQLQNKQKLEKLSFQIWKDREKLNPQKWLIRQ